MLKVLSDNGVRSSIIIIIIINILVAYTSAPFIKTDDNDTTTCSTMGGKFSTTKTVM
jgi:hypothetical protein